MKKEIMACDICTNEIPHKEMFLHLKRKIKIMDICLACTNEIAILAILYTLEFECEAIDEKHRKILIIKD